MESEKMRCAGVGIAAQMASPADAGIAQAPPLS
jgi:hypothetical protein